MDVRMTDGKIAYDDTADTGEEGAMADRSPDSIQREIEQTRAELADTIDAIADRISPKRVASRGAQAVKAQVSSVLGNGNGAGHGAPASVLDAPASVSAKVDSEARARDVRAIAAAGGGAAYTGTSEFEVSRRLRTDRVLLLVGALAATVAAVILWRSRD